MFNLAVSLIESTNDARGPLVRILSLYDAKMVIFAEVWQLLR